MIRHVPLAALILFSLPVFGAEIATPNTVTFSHDVAPIVYQHCVACHHPNDIAPMSLLTYKEARPWARAIEQAVLTRKMPPWQADPHYGEFSNDPRLNETEIATIKQWVDTGAKEGDPREMPAIPSYPDGWRIGKPDVVIPIPKDFVVKTNGPDQYEYFNVPTNFTEDRWVQAVELRPGNRLVVHHAHVYLFNPPSTSAAKKDVKTVKKQEVAFTILDGEVHHINPAMPVVDDGCSSPDGGDWPGHRPSESGTILGSYLPGKEPDVFPAGYARKIPKGATLQFQIHYHPGSIAEDQIDRTSVGFIFAKEPPKQPLRRIDIQNMLFEIPAGDPDHRVTACYTFDKDVEFMSYTAHMHLRGKDMKFEAVHPDGRRETLFSVPNYDFNWQNEYKLKHPVPIEKGTKIIITAHFDNSVNNKDNPDPTKTIRYGEPSTEEMMGGWFEYILPDKPLSAAVR